jgi:DNA repair protein RecO (recombination protein O)
MSASVNNKGKNMSYIKADGIVIKEVNTGEADRIVTILTKNRGKISAFAKNSRRPRSNLVAGTQIMWLQQLCAV